MKEPTIITSKNKKNDVYTATCCVTGIETRSKIETQAVEECRLKSIEMLQKWIVEIQNNLYSAKIIADEETKQQATPEEQQIQKELETLLNCEVVPFTGLDNYFITVKKDIYQYIDERFEKVEANQCYDYIMIDKERYYYSAIMYRNFRDRGIVL